MTTQFLYRVVYAEVDEIVRRFFASALTVVSYDPAQDGLVRNTSGIDDFLIRGSINNTTFNNNPATVYTLSDNVVDLRLVAESDGTSFVLAAFALGVDNNSLDYTFICTSSGKTGDDKHVLLLDGVHSTRSSVPLSAVKNSAPGLSGISNLPTVNVYPAYVVENTSNRFLDEVPTQYVYALGNSDAPAEKILQIGGRNYIVAVEGTRKLALFFG